MLMRVRAAAVAALFLVALAACSPRQMALTRMASALAAASAVYENDNDLEFVRLAAPSTLKTIEMLLEDAPKNKKLLLTACSGFTQYSYGFLHVEAEMRAQDAASNELKARAAKMYQRARGYCLRGLEQRHPRLTLAALVNDPAGTLNVTTIADVPWLYWTAASWGADLSLAPNPILRVTELATVRALLNRAKALDEKWESGAIHEALIAFDGLPPLLGGSPAAARADFDRAMELSDRKSVFAYVALAAATTTDGAEKRKLLEQAITVDTATLTSRRLTNLIAQRYAKAMLSASR
jgi:hypothetical protein